MKTSSLILSLLLFVYSSLSSYAGDTTYSKVSMNLRTVHILIDIWHDGSVFICDFKKVEHKEITNYYKPKTVYSAPAKSVDFNAFVAIENIKNDKSFQEIWVTVSESGFSCPTVKASNNLTKWENMLINLTEPKDPEQKALLDKALKTIKLQNKSQ